MMMDYLIDFRVSWDTDLGHQISHSLNVSHTLILDKTTVIPTQD